jgi:hypothetical protein
MKRGGPPQELVQYFGKLYREKVGEIYPPTWSRDLKMFREWLEIFPQERIERLLDIYFEQNERLYSIPFFKVRLAELVQRLAQEEMNKPQPMEDNESWRFE